MVWLIYLVKIVIDIFLMSFWKYDILCYIKRERKLEYELVGVLIVSCWIYLCLFVFCKDRVCEMICVKIKVILKRSVGRGWRECN